MGDIRIMIEKIDRLYERIAELKTEANMLLEERDKAEQQLTVANTRAERAEKRANRLRVSTFEAKSDLQMAKRFIEKKDTGRALGIIDMSIGSIEDALKFDDEALKAALDASDKTDDLNSTQ